MPKRTVLASPVLERMRTGKSRSWRRAIAPLIASLRFVHFAQILEARLSCRKLVEIPVPATYRNLHLLDCGTYISHFGVGFAGRPMLGEPLALQCIRASLQQIKLRIFSEEL